MTTREEIEWNALFEKTGMPARPEGFNVVHWGSDFAHTLQLNGKNVNVSFDNDFAVKYATLCSKSPISAIPPHMFSTAARLFSWHTARVFGQTFSLFGLPAIGDMIEVGASAERADDEDPGAGFWFRLVIKGRTFSDDTFGMPGPHVRFSLGLKECDVMEWLDLSDEETAALLT